MDEARAVSRPQQARSPAPEPRAGAVRNGAPKVRKNRAWPSFAVLGEAYWTGETYCWAPRLRARSALRASRMAAFLSSPCTLASWMEAYMV